jgi:hypothetical protein
MLLGIILEDFYKKLIEDENITYKQEGIRDIVSRKCELILLNIVDRIPSKSVDIKIKEFLNFLWGYDLPDLDNQYLHSKFDLEKAYKELGDIKSLVGYNIEIIDDAIIS